MNEKNQEPVAAERDLEQILARGRSRARLGRRGRWILVAVLLAGVVLAYMLFVGGDDGARISYTTEPVENGTLVVTVSATGNLQPTNQVDVGSELSGIVEEVFVDDNDEVSQDQVLARLDRSRLEDAVARSRANVAVAEAQVLQAEATEFQSRASLTRLQRVSSLSDGKVPSRSEMEAAEADLKRAEANLASARAGVVQARAALQSDQTNLEKTLIRSPIDGVVLSRQVEPGQTVAASFQAPVLFTLAEDLTQMELQVDVDEADVGKVEVGQGATFAVDAWPGRTYEAMITQVGFGSVVKEGVVSYPATLQVDNSDLSLRPGMTATAEITTLTRDNALLAPNAALRFVPPAADTAGRSSGGGLLGALVPRRPRPTSERGEPVSGGGGSRQLWILRDGQPVPVTVETGATDGRVTEITGGAIEAGTDVITEATVAR
jgi:HlyD family secretion protein